MVHNWPDNTKYSSLHIRTNLTLQMILLYKCNVLCCYLLRPGSFVEKLLVSVLTVTEIFDKPVGYMDRLASNHRNTSRLRHERMRQRESKLCDHVDFLKSRKSIRLPYTERSACWHDQPSAYWYDQPSACWHDPPSAYWYGQPCTYWQKMMDNSR